MVWIKRMLHKQLIIYSGIVMAVVVMVILIRPIIAVWIGPEMVVSEPLVIAIGVFVLVSTWNNIYAMFVNGIGSVNIQLYTSVIAMLLNIPLSIIFVKYFSLGLSGIVMATIVSLSLAAIALPIQVNYIMRANKRAIPA
jgi:O-antigen/teichoic acid export membrane protein